MSKIGIIADSAARAHHWRLRACIAEGYTPWLNSIVTLNGLTLYSIICIPAWTERHENHAILAEARRHLAQQPACEVQAENAAVDSEDVVYPNVEVPLAAFVPNPEPLVSGWIDVTNEMREGIIASRAAERERAFPMTPTPASGSDEALCRTVIGPTLFGLMGDPHRRLLAGDVRAGRSPEWIHSMIQSLERIYSMEQGTAALPVRPPTQRALPPTIAQTLPLADNFRDTMRAERMRMAEERAARPRRSELDRIGDPEF